MSIPLNSFPFLRGRLSGREFPHEVAIALYVEDADTNSVAFYPIRKRLRIYPEEENSCESDRM